MGFDFDASIARAEVRLGRERVRAKRRDSGQARIDARVLELVHGKLSGQERPDLVAVHASVIALCRAVGLKPPARSSLYAIADRMPGRMYALCDLPEHVRETLHNVAPTAEVPGRQIAFACVNYGDARALAFAASLPWLDLHQARGLRGYREKSIGVLNAICAARGL